MLIAIPSLLCIFLRHVVRLSGYTYDKISSCAQQAVNGVITDNNGNTLAETKDGGFYHYGNDLISQYTAQDGYHYYGYDGLGSTQLLTDEGGAVAASLLNCTQN